MSRIGGSSTGAGIGAGAGVGTGFSFTSKVLPDGLFAADVEESLFLGGRVGGGAAATGVGTGFIVTVGLGGTGGVGIFDAAGARDSFDGAGMTLGGAADIDTCDGGDIILGGNGGGVASSV
jgi:hypothetical protein